MGDGAREIEREWLGFQFGSKWKGNSIDVDFIGEKVARSDWL